MTSSQSSASPEPRPAGRFGLGALLAVTIVTAVLAVGATLLLSRRGAHIVAGSAVENGAPASLASDSGSGHPETLYQCPMHPTVVKNHPGDCPICGMKLVKVEPSAAAGSGSAGGERRIVYYRSPMNPSQTSPTPMKDDMGMDYLPVYSDEVGGDAVVPGLATVAIDPARQQLIGLKTATVRHGVVGGAWRTVGRVEVDETRVRHINVKIPGYVERIFVDFVGRPVGRGEPLFAMYSPELVAAQDELLLAARTEKKLGASGQLHQDGATLLAAARRKLALWDVPQAEIARVERTGEPMKALTFVSPIKGVVTKKDVVEGMKLDAGAMPYEIVDLSEVWVLADVYESDLEHVAVGMPAALTLKAFPHRTFEGQVSFIDPLLDPSTRTVKVRLVFPNPTGELRPAMFGEVILKGEPREGLQIPADAVIESGTRNVVFVALGEGKFQPREVETGDSDGTRIEVISGLTEGEEVVTRANFLIDSESRLRASLAALTPSGTPPAAGGATSGHAHEGSSP